MSVPDRTAIVTGAGSVRGIGRATAHALAASGWHIAILDIDEVSAKEAAAFAEPSRAAGTASPSATRGRREFEIPGFKFQILLC